MNHPHMPPASCHMSRSRFLILAALVQGGVLLLAILGGYLLGISPTQLVRWSLRDLIGGLLAVLPLLLVYRFSPDLRQQATDTLGESLSRCRWYDLVGLAGLAGIGEELLFRGVLYEGLVPFHPWLALIICNVVFGLLHALSWNYFLAATCIGFSMHALAGLSEPRNLLAPMVAHGVYDLVAFFLLRREQSR
jgi:uncharacterized protein